MLGLARRCGALQIKLFILDTQIKYYKVDFVPIDNFKIWLFEFRGDDILREIGIDDNNNVIHTLPDKKYPRGLFGDSPVSFKRGDMVEISKEEFEAKWNQ